MRNAALAVSVWLAAVLVPVGPKTVSAPPSPAKLCDGFLPPNDLSIPIGSMEAKGITKEQFDQVMDVAQKLYGPIIAAKGGELVIERDWENSTVNAYAQRNGNQYVIHMFGGLARHETITQDGMALVACHEIGHHLAGFPRKGGWGGAWASNEGQSDYFANAKCLRRYFLDGGAKSFTRMDASDAVAQQSCDASFSGAADRAACVRGAMAGKSVSRLFKVLRRETKDPAFDTPDPKKVETTDHNHPGTQCRMDTYYQGSLCGQPYAADFAGDNYKGGACTRAGGFATGIRPRCWFKPPAEEPEAISELWGAAAAATRKSLAESSAFSRLRSPDVW